MLVVINFNATHQFLPQNILQSLWCFAKVSLFLNPKQSITIKGTVGEIKYSFYFQSTTKNYLEWHSSPERTAHNCRGVAHPALTTLTLKHNFGVPQPRRLITSLLTEGSRLRFRPVHVGFVMGKMALGLQHFLLLLRVSPISIIKPTVYTHSFIYSWSYKIL